MSLRGLEKLDVSIVVTSAMNATIDISGIEIQSILPDVSMQAVGQPIQQMQLTSLREQVIVTVAGGRLVFQDRGGQDEPKVRLAEIVDGFVRLMSAKGVDQFGAYGFNFDIAFDARGDLPAGKVITERFIRTDELIRRGNIGVEGSGLRLYFAEAAAKCDLRIEPRESKLDTFKYFAHINYHYDLPDRHFPPLETLRSDFLGKWTLFIQLLERLLM